MFLFFFLKGCHVHFLLGLGLVHLQSTLGCLGGVSCLSWKEAYKNISLLSLYFSTCSVPRQLWERTPQGRLA